MELFPVAIDGELLQLGLNPINIETCYRCSLTTQLGARKFTLSFP